jgi:uncharacterized protein (DUF39 family)
LKPGKILLVDTLEGKVLYDKELKKKLADDYPYGKWIQQNMVRLEEIETGHIVSPGMGDKYQDYVTAFNYSLEDIEKIIGEMAATV